MMNNNIPFYIAAALIFIVLKFGFRLLDTKSLLFLLTPVSIVVEIATGTKAVYSPESGYYFKSLNIAIDKSCTGYNFGLLCFLMLYSLILKFCRTVFQKAGVLMVSMGMAFLLTILVNSCRIISSIAVAKLNSSSLFMDEHLAHQAVGILINLSFLILIYLSLNLILIKKQHAKFIKS